MRWWVNIILSVILIVLIIPTLIIKGFSSDEAGKGSISGDDEHGDEISITRRMSEPDVLMYDHSAKKVVRLPIEEYVVGAVAAEMPASFELEALKAQAIAARTLAIKMRAFGGRGCEKHPQADICSMFNHCQAWISSSR